MTTTTHTATPETLHEAWALASLMRARYGREALSQAEAEAGKSKSNSETISIWNKVIECLRH